MCMTDIEEIRGQIDRVEASIEKRPGDAQAELEALMVGIGKLIAERQTNAQQLLRNEDFVGPPISSLRTAYCSSAVRACSWSFENRCADGGSMTSSDKDSS